MFIGLCINCKHRQVISSAKGSFFFLCSLSKVDPSFPKYPLLPVLACSGYQPEGKPAKEKPARE